MHCSIKILKDAIDFDLVMKPEKGLIKVVERFGFEWKACEDIWKIFCKVRDYSTKVR